MWNFLSNKPVLLGSKISSFYFLDNNEQDILEDYPILSGNGLIQLNGGTIEKTYDTPTVIQRRRKLQTENCNGYLFEGDESCSCTVWGDVNNDCLVCCIQFVLSLLCFFLNLKSELTKISRANAFITVECMC